MKFHQHKYHAKPTSRKGQKFPSQKEAEYYDQLCILQKMGHIIFFLRQVPFHLPGNVVYRVDFVEFHRDGTVHFVDVKGYETPEFIKNKKMVEALYPIKIEVKK